MLSAFFFGRSMNVNIWMALALVLVLEGLGPMFMPRLWRRVILSMTQLPDRLLHRFGGGLVVAGMVIYCMLRLHGEL
jgi:uncharacterized protein YjeT (DUF2065 family)